MSYDDPFKAGSAGGAGITEYDGQLLLVVPTEYVQGVKTSYGEADAVRVNFVVLDAPDGIEEVEDTLVFQRVLISAFKAQAKFNERNPDGDPANGYPKMTLGRLFQDEKQKKQGQSAPWVLGEPTEEDKALARMYLPKLKREPADPFAGG